MVGVRSADEVHLHRVVNDQIDGNEGLHAFGIGAELCGGVAHGRQIHEQRHAGEVLQYYARDHERHFVVARVLGVPRGKPPDIALRGEFSAAVAQYAFEHYPHAHRQAGDVEPAFFEGGKAVYETLRAGLFRFKFC